MDWICLYLNNTLYQFGDLQHTTAPVTCSENLTITDNPLPYWEENKKNSSHEDAQIYLDIYEYIVMNLFIPLLCLVGIVGNCFNILILLKRLSEGTDKLEKGATIGLIVLAMSDLGFCLCTFIASFVPHNLMIYSERNLTFVVTIYWNYTQNLLIKLSTWFTLILSIGRYYAVCFPMKARQCMRCKHTVLAIVACGAFWICCYLPLLWLWDVSQIDCSHMDPRMGKFLIVTTGYFQNNIKFMLIMNYFWATLGFFLPVGTLGFCNYKLVQSLRSSRKFRRPPGSTISTPLTHDPQKRISITLICIVVMFFLLVCPSEMLHFYWTIEQPENKKVHRAALILTNLLLALNFSINFILYCAVNAYFRKVIQSLLGYFKWRGSRSIWIQIRTHRGQLVTSSRRNSSGKSRLSRVTTIN